MLSGAILGTEKIAGNMHSEIYHTLDHARPVYELWQANIGESESGANQNIFILPIPLVGPWKI